MYCINCGVKLADTEQECPLCKTKVYHPDIPLKTGEPIYPANKFPVKQSDHKWPQVVFTVMFIIPIITVLLVDFLLDHSITWSGFVVGALTSAYVMFGLPSWFGKPNPVIFVPCSFVAIGVYLLYIDIVTPGSWFLSFAFPVVGGIGIIITAVTALLRYVHNGKLYIFGGACIALGSFMLLVEFLANYTFERSNFIGWSLYPLTTLVVVGGMLIFLAICRPARESMEQKFFI